MADDVVNIGLVIPSSGPSGIFGPSCRASAELAVAEVNRVGGILGRRIVLSELDGGGDVRALANGVRSRAMTKDVDAVVGWHTSAARVAVSRALRGRVPYVYTAVYEGGEYSPGTFMTGEVPDEQVIPALRWMSREVGVRRWYVVGSDYVWPRMTARITGRAAVESRGEFSIEGEAFLPLGADGFTEVIEDIRRSRVSGVLILLLGQDAVNFNREFSSSGLAAEIVRLGPLMDENMILAGGASANDNLYSVSGFFESLNTETSMDFCRHLAQERGHPGPPVSSPGESCYEGIMLLSRLADAAGSLDMASLSDISERGITYVSPRGEVRLQEQHLRQDMYIATMEEMGLTVVDRVHITTS